VIAWASPYSPNDAENSIDVVSALRSLAKGFVDHLNTFLKPLAERGYGKMLLAAQSEQLVGDVNGRKYRNAQRINGARGFRHEVHFSVNVSGQFPHINFLLVTVKIVFLIVDLDFQRFPRRSLYREARRWRWGDD